MDQDWAGLPTHILDSILEKFEKCTDILRFGAVCVSWHSITKDNQIKRNKMLCHQQVPMLLVPSEQEHTWSIYNVVDHKFLELKLSLSYNRRFSGSSQGWLVIANEDLTVTLHKPCFMTKEDNSDSNMSVHLPCLMDSVDLPEPDPEEDWEEDLVPFEDFNEENVNGYLIPGSDYNILKAFITADPLTNSHDCTIAVIYGPTYKLASIRYGIDTTWTKFPCKDYGVKDFGWGDILYYKNLFYAVHFDGCLISFDPCKSTIKKVAPGIASISNKTLKRYLVELCGILLQVERYMGFRQDGHERVTKFFRVLKLDFDRSEWIEIDNLGDMALFIGDNSSLSVFASELNGCKANCIYFTHDEAALLTRTNASCDLGIYSLKSGSFKLYCDLDSTIFQRISKRPPSWIIPPSVY